MLDKIFRFSLVFLFIGFLNACAGNGFYHEYIMSGQIVAVNDDQVVICIGSEGGAEVGMELDIYEVVTTGSMEDDTYSYELDMVGQVEIESIIDKHFVNARIVQGNVEKYNIVQLRDE